MTEPSRIDRLHWDDWNRGHIGKDAVLPEEEAEVVAGNAIVRESYKQRLQFVGPTFAGRMLSVVVGAVPGQLGTYYGFSARPASREERALYSQMEGGSIP